MHVDVHVIEFAGMHSCMHASLGHVLEMHERKEKEGSKQVRVKRKEGG